MNGTSTMVRRRRLLPLRPRASTLKKLGVRQHLRRAAAKKKQ
jgi:hypothetical protein